MASAPDWSDEEKKLRRRLSRGPTDFGSVEDIVGRARAAAAQPRAAVPPIDIESIAESGRAAGRTLRANEGRRAGGLGRSIERAILGTRGIPELADAPAAAGQVAPERIERGDPRNQFGNVFDSSSDLSPTALRGAGLQRVVKTADGTYTDAPTATGDVRYYNQFGNRADLGEVKYDGAGLTGPQAAAAHLAAENAAALDMSDPANARLVLERGREAQRQFSERQDQLAERQQLEFLASLDPADRAELTTERIKESGLDRRAAATIAATTRGQDIQLQGQRAALINARGTQAQRDFDNQLKLSERLEDPATRQAEIARILAPLRGQSQEDVVNFIAQNPAAQAALAALEDDARNRTSAIGRLSGYAPTAKGSIGKLGGLSRGSTFADLSDDNLFPGYADKNALLGGYVDPSALNPALDEELFRNLIAFRQAQSADKRSR